MSLYRVTTYVRVTFLHEVEAEDEEAAQEAAWELAEEICIDIDDSNGFEWVNADAREVPA